MQEDVSDIIKLLGIVPPIKATPVRYPLDHTSSPGCPMHLTLSTGDGFSCITSFRSGSPESQPPQTSEPVLHNFVIPKLDAPMRQCSTLKNGMDQCRNGGTMVGSSVPYTDGLSQALSNYKLVNQPGPSSARSQPVDDIKKNPSESTVTSTHECVTPMAANMKQRRAPNFKPIFTGQPTGFRVCRPLGTFVWPSRMSYTPGLLPKNNPSMTRQDQSVQLRGIEDGSGNSSTRQVSGISSLSPTMARSIAESQVAATMASMFGCMANMAPHLSKPTLPLMTNETHSSVKGTEGTASTHMGHCSSPPGQSDATLSLSLSLSVSSGSTHSNKDALKKQKST